ncbi:MAG: hypothetical protein IJC81_05420 [Clostridia bacterium]|nr:hypothetical protein [Clostridia bacterium]
MKKFFPLSFFGKNLKSVILSTLIYTLIIVAVAIIVGCINLSETLGIVVNIIRQFILLYSASGIVIAVLNACDLLRDAAVQNAECKMQNGEKHEQ